MSTDNPNRDDLQDRLLDQALREKLGGEAPPDLKEKILTAARGLATTTTSPSTPGENAMNAQHHNSHFPWLQAALAASLLVSITWFLLPDIQPARERARGTPHSSEVKQPESQAVPVENTATVPDDGTILLDDIKRLSESQREPTGTKEITLSVTPHIIIEDGGEKLEIAIGGRVGDSEALVPNFEAELNQPGRWHSLGRTIPQLDQRPQISAAGKQKEQSNVVMRNDFSGAPGQNINRYLFEHDETRWGFRPQIEGHGPGNAGDQYTRIHENPFVVAEGEKAVSTFSIDVDTAAYANVRQFLMRGNQLPPADAVRIEELVNYFDYDYSGPTGDVPFAAHVEVAGCPWQPEHRLVRVGIKGREIERQRRPLSNLVFLIDVSGSMNQPNKLPLLVEGMKLLTHELGENDRVAIVVYASSEGLALESTPGDKQDTILAALDQLQAGGSTAGGAGIELAYKTAKQHFIQGGVNRVILATDGDFNVGVTSPAALERMAETKAKETGIFLTVLGFGRGNLNDAMMEKISGKGNGNYHYIDNRTEARKVLVEEMAGTLVTIAKDVKIQIEFNPSQVAGYRLIGYENRMLATEDFNDDKKDAGEIGAGHTVTALYEIVPAGKSVDTPGVDPLKYQAAVDSAKTASDGVGSDELLTLKIRYKRPDGEKSTKLEFPITDNGQSFATASDDFQFAAAVASFGMLLRESEHRGNATFEAVLEIASAGAGRDLHEYRAEFLTLVRRAKQLRGE